MEASEVLDENVIKNLLNNVPNSNKLQELESYTKEDFSKFTETELFVWRVSFCMEVDFLYGGLGFVWRLIFFTEVDFLYRG